MKPAEDLAKEYDFKTDDDYFNYIVESLINGNRQQVRDLFNKMITYDKQRFLTEHLDITKGIEKSVLNICIDELCK